MREDLVVQAAPQPRPVPRRRLSSSRRCAAAPSPPFGAGSGRPRAATTCAPPWTPRLQTAARDRADERAGGLRPPPRLARRLGQRRHRRRAGRRRPRRKPPPAERRDWRAAVVESVAGNAVQRPHCADGRRRAALVAADVAWANAGKGAEARRPDLRRAGRAAAATRLRQVPAVNGALVAIEPQSGRVLAMVGGYSFSLSNFNRATQAHAPAGLGLQAVRLRHGAGERLHARLAW